MGTRTNDLTEFAKPIADNLANRCGSLKRVLSAGILALDDMSPGDREYYMAKAIGEEIERTYSTDAASRAKSVVDHAESRAKEIRKKRGRGSAKSA